MEFEKPRTSEEIFDLILHKQVDKLKTLTMDLSYHREVSRLYDEDKLRDDLAKEEKKCLKDKTGRIIKDSRDFKRIQELNADIDRAVSAKKEILTFSDTIASITRYVEYMRANKKSLLKEFDKFNVYVDGIK